MSNKNFMKAIAFNAGRYSKEKEFWTTKLAGRTLRSSFPYDFNKIEQAQSNENIRSKECLKFQIPPEVFAKLMWIINESDLRLFMILVTGIMILINKHTGQEDILIGAPIERQEVEGNFLNTILALRAQLETGMTFKDFLLQVKQVIMEAGENQNFPIERIPYELNMEVRQDEAFALFDTVVLLENLHDPNYIAHIPFNMVFSFLKTPGSIDGVVEYNPLLYKKETVQRITGHFIQMFRETVANLDIPIAKLNIIPKDEMEFLLVKMNDNSAEYPTIVIHKLFEDQVEKTPGNIAVEEADTGRIICYKELNRRADQLAGLLKEKGACPGTIIAIMGERTADIVTSLLAILKTGAIFLPLDAQNPDERLRFILADSGAGIFISQKTIVTQRESIFKGFSSKNKVVMDDEDIYKSNGNPGENLTVSVSPMNPAYIIYTSGTTGKPKGVIIEHKSLVNYIHFAVKNYVKEGAGNFPLYTSIAFDLTITSIFTPLVTGNAVVVYSGWNKGNLIERIIDDNKVGIIKLTPSHLNLIEEKKYSAFSGNIRCFVVGGEVLKYQIAREVSNNFNGKVDIYNEYGPTEATVGCMLYKFDPVKDYGKGSSVSIGVPAANVQIYLLDKNHGPVPIGAVGEIHIGGDGLARGYLNQPQLTAERFQRNNNRSYTSYRPYILYKTGDLARCLEDGNIEFLGRIDQQVKIRGFRIELGEIETQLLGYGEIKEAAAIIKEAAGDKHLCAYLVPGKKGKELSASVLREYLTGKLPDYMIPSYFVWLEAMPLTINGKVDTAALPDPEVKAERAYIAPRDEVEKKMAGIWSEILAVETGMIGIDANFFELGGHSLSGTVLTAKIHKAFDVKLALADLFRMPTIRELAQLLDKTRKMKFSPLEPAEEKEYYALSSAQERLFIIQQMDLDSIGYNVPLVCEIEGKLNLEEFHNVFCEIIERHDVLRTSFILIDNKPVQRVHDQSEFEFEYFDVVGVESSPLKDSEIQRIINLFIRPFDLSRVPLLRVGLIRTDWEGEHFILMMDIHHIITDGVSMDILVKEIGALYTGHQLSPLKLHYKDFSEWQHSETVRKEMMKQEAYWLKKFAGEIPVLELPVDFRRPSFQSFEGDRINFNLENHEITRLRELAATQGVTLFMMILSVYNIFLSKLSGQSDLIIGTPIAGRRHADLEYIVGIFINTLALRNYPEAEKPFLEFLHEVKINTLDAYENQEYQYEDLVTKVSIKRDTSRNPLLDAMFALNNVDTQFLDIPKFNIPDLKIAPYQSSFLASKVDILLNGFEDSENVYFTLEYSTKLFKQETISRFIKRFKQAISCVLANSYQKIAEIAIIPDEEKQQILYDFNNTMVEYPKNKVIHQLFESQAMQTPDNTAIIFSRGDYEGINFKPSFSMTYKELNYQSDRLAYVLREKRVEPDTIVGIMVERSIEMIIGIYGILKAGGAYLPIDPSHPQERIDFMLKDSRARLLVTINDKQDEKLRKWGGEKISLESISISLKNSSYPLTFLPSYLHNSSNHAYVIYTSGSTGRPKGVIINHRNVINFMTGISAQIDFSVGKTILAITTISFDIFVLENLLPLAKGMKVVIASTARQKDPIQLTEIIIANCVQMVQVTPSTLKLLLSIDSSSCFDGLSELMVGGEEFPPHLFSEIKKVYTGKIYNLYGPTETTVWSAVKDLTGAGKVDIGRPIGNTQIYILANKYMTLQPVGCAGELFIGGDGVAVGYLNRPELTSGRFLRNYRSNGSYRTNILYKTGDLSRWLADGNIEFLGRLDSQVKLRGFRIELGEIESKIKSYNLINETVVAAKKDEKGDDYLCAYIVSKCELNVSELREYLSRELPDYMIPSYFVNLAEIPVNINGKIDYKALPEPTGITLRENLEYVPPTTPVEKKLVEIWEKVLGKNNIGINENFFLIGGDSIKSIQIISRLSNTGYKIEMRDLFKYPIIADLARLAKKIKRLPEQSVITGTIPLTPIQRGFFTQFPNDSKHYSQAIMFYAREKLDSEAIKKVFSRLHEHHDALRMTFKRQADGSEIIQTDHGSAYPFSLEEYDLKNLANSLDKFEVKINEIKSSIDLEKGPLMKLGLFHLNDGDRLLVVVHQLVIDGVSWRVLLEDIDTLYGQYKRGERLVLPPKTDSFKRWSERLSVYANSKSFLKETSYWAKLESYAATEIPNDFEAEGNYVKDIQPVSFNLGEKETALLLTRVNEAFKTEVNDILLTALGLGIQETFAQDRILLALEGNGRESILEDTDISRTVGWFTSVYPILIDFTYGQDLGRQLKEIKEVMRKIPNQGMGYGILKYLTNKEHREDIQFRLKPKISFNYLGQIDTDVNRLSSFESAKEVVGDIQGIVNQSGYDLDIKGMIAKNSLSMTIYFNKMHFKTATMEKLASNIESQLNHIIEFCSSKEKSEFSPSDFTHRALSIEHVDRLMELYPDLEDIYSLTSMQEGLLFHTLMDDSSYSYFEQMSYRLQGELDIKLIEKSLQELVKRHEILRTVFVYKNIDRPVQVVLKNSMIDFCYEDINKLARKEEKESFIKEFRERDKGRPFNLNKGPLMRVVIIHVAEWEYEFTWSFHHILMDGWCIGILNAEFFEIYSAYKQNRAYQLPGINSYRTYIQWLEKQDKDAPALYWKNYLDSFEKQTGVPKTRILTKEDRYRNETFSVVLDSKKTAALNRLAAANHVTLNIVTQTIWGILLGKYNGKEDVVFGAVVSGRPFELEGIESMVGLFINTIPIRIRFAERMKLNMLFRKTQEEALASEPHHYHPLAEIQAESILKQNLLDHLLAFENYPISDRLEGFENGRDKRHTLSFKLTNVDIFEQIHYDFNIVLAGTDRLKITFKFNGNAYDTDFVEKIANLYCSLFDQVSENGEIEVGDLLIVSELEKKQLLYDFNNTEAGYPSTKTIQQLFAEQVVRIPDYIAVSGNSIRLVQPVGDVQPASLTYRQLNEQSDGLAELLIEKGVLPDTIVAIMMERSIEMIVAIISILKAGGAYLPIDPNYPQERIDYMLKDSNAKILINKSEIRNPKLEKNPNDQNTNDQNKKRNSGAALVLNFENLNFEFVSNFGFRISGLNPSNLAYIIYTSGTTGKPKGVLIEHGNVVRLLFNDRCLFDFTTNDTWTMFHSYCFDFSVWEMYGALLYGGKLIIISKIVSQDPRAFLTLLRKQQVTILNQTPSAFYNLITEEMKSLDQSLDLRYVIFGGEALSPAKLKEWQKKYPRTKLINMFGITETTVHVTYKEITAKEIEAGVSCIGKPIPTLSTYIFDRGLKLAPIGTPGELCVGGRGVGRGYLNRPELSHEKFVRNLYKPLERLYKSGDLAKLANDGEMEYLGRIDQQVQIRGFRVEIGEIENRLLKHEDIKDVVVIAKEDKDSNLFLAAYIVSEHGLSVSQLREFVANELPEYMIPAYFVRVPQIPLTLNGKLDKSKLPEPDVIGRGDDADYVPPANEIEAELAVAWKEVLGLEKIGVKDNFFNIGGDSIKAIRLVNSINERLQVNIKILDLFTNNTIKELAQIVNSGIPTPHDEELQEIEKEVEELKTRIMNSGKMPEDVEDVFPMSDIEKGMIFHSYENPEEAIYHDQFVYQRKYPSFEPDIFRKALGLVSEKHSILRTSFNVDDFNEFVHFIHKPFPAVYNHFDISGLDNQQKEQYILNYMENDRKDRWNISRTPLWRMATFNRGNDIICAVWTFHHAILDGWSNASIITELNNVYLALKTDKNYNPGRLKITYKDFVIREMLAKKKIENVNFWKKELADYKRIYFPVISNKERGEIHDFVPPPVETLVEQLMDAVKRYNTSLKHLCFAAYVYMLSMLTYESDVIMGLISNNRPELEDGDKIIGCFLNTLPFRINIPAEITWEYYVRLVDKKLLQLKKYEKITFFEIVKIIGEGNRVGNPLFDTIFNYIDFHIYKQAIEVNEQKELNKDLLIQGYERTNTLFDFTVHPIPQGIKAAVRYSTSIVDDEMVNKLYGYFEKILIKFITCPNELVKKDEILSDEEKQKLLFGFNYTDHEYPQDKTIDRLFAEQVEQIPAHIAVFGCGQTASGTGANMYITYKALNDQSNRFAYFLKEKGIMENTIVGIMADRSIEIIMGLLGILKAGAAYLPIDSDYPRERIDFILKDSGTKFLIATNTKENEKLGTWQGEIYDIQSYFHSFFFHSLLPGLPVSLRNSANPAYIIYTSGSTGRPKGVIIEHRSLVNYIWWAAKQYTKKEKLNFPFYSSVSFDLTVTSIFTPLITGNVIIIYPNKDKEFLIEKIVDDNDVNIIKLTPSHLKLIQEKQIDVPSSNLKRLIVGGEKFEVSLARDIYSNFGERIEIYNEYGPTEATVGCMTYKFNSLKDNGESVSIGIPIDNARIYILDKYLRPVPAGVLGEINIGGLVLARGYLNRYELTAERFVDNAFIPGEKIYRTGDLARMLPDGNIEFWGRLDTQVKIRGFRIEPGEIENLLLTHEGVKEAFLLGKKKSSAGQDNEYILCAYIVPVSKDNLTTTQLREYLMGKLPAYMIPSYFIFLESMPLTANGKIDTNALPEAVLEIGKNYKPARNIIEKKLVEIWSIVLGVAPEKISIDDNFFEMGGHSINAIALMSRIYKSFNVRIPIVEIFKNSTIQGISGYIKDATKKNYCDIEKAEKKEYYPMSSQQKGLYFIQKLDPENISYNMAMILSLEETIQRDKLEDVLKKLIHRHEGLRTSFEIINDQPIQRIHNNIPFEIAYSEMNEAEAEMEIRGFKKPFDLGIAPLMRAKLIKLSNDKHILLFGLHHIIVDAESSNILTTDFLKLFANKDKELTPLKLQYTDYSEWHLRLSQSGELDKQEEYWLNRFRGELPLLKMATDFPRPVEKILEGNRVRRELDKEQTTLLRKYIRKSETTLYIFVLSVYTVLLAKYSGQEDIVVGSPISGRNHPDLYNILGLFANMLAMRNFPKENFCYRDFLKEVKTNALDAFENHDYQFTELVSKLDVTKDISRHPLFDVVLAFDNTGTETIDNTGFTFESYGHDTSGLKFDLLLDLIEDKETIHFDLNYSTALFKPATAEKILQHLVEILKQVVENDSIILRDIKISHDLINVEYVFPVEEADIFEF